LCTVYVARYMSETIQPVSHRVFFNKIPISTVSNTFFKLRKTTAQCFFLVFALKIAFCSLRRRCSHE
jgi:hypothetical protein